MPGVAPVTYVTQPDGTVIGYAPAAAVEAHMGASSRHPKKDAPGTQPPSQTETSDVPPLLSPTPDLMLGGGSEGKLRRVRAQRLPKGSRLKRWGDTVTSGVGLDV